MLGSTVKKFSRTKVVVTVKMARCCSLNLIFWEKEKDSIAIKHAAKKKLDGRAPNSLNKRAPSGYESICNRENAEK